MNLFNLSLILGSACIHVVAHVALKRAHDRLAFVWWLLLWGGVVYAPVLLWPRAPIPLAGWGLMALSAVFEAAYFYAIAQAYQTGDLSLVYPLARGTAPLLLLIWSAVFLGEAASPGGVAGVLCIALGLYAINLPRLGAWSAPLRSLRQPAARWAMLAGLGISLYTVIDRAGIRLAPPLLYTYLALWLTLAVLTPAVWRRVGWAGLRAEWRSARWASVLAGFTTLTAYAMVLYAMQNGLPASYAGATREISVVFGAAIGVFFFKESRSPTRFVGAALVAAGVAVIAVWG